MNRPLDTLFANVIGLGGLRAVYTRSHIYRLLAVVLAGIVLLPLLFNILTRSSIADWDLAEVLFSILGAPLVFWIVWGKPTNAVGLYDGGLAFYHRGELVLVPWKEIVAFGAYYLPITHADEDMPPALMPSIKTSRGREFNLAGLGGIKELWAAIEHNVEARREEDMDAGGGQPPAE